MSWVCAMILTVLNMAGVQSMKCGEGRLFDYSFVGCFSKPVYVEFLHWYLSSIKPL